MQYKKTIILLLVLVLIGGSIYFIEKSKPKRISVENVAPIESLPEAPRTPDFDQKSKKYPRAVELVNPSGFINTDPFKIKDLIGKKVILLDFWTYSCINCQRTFPYLNSWYEKYKDDGFVIVGVHAPEFEFEKKTENVISAAKKFDIKYPIVQDNNFETWSAYKNQYWPEHYLIDINGFIVDKRIGEGGYAETETKIKELLKERALALGEIYEEDKGITIVNQKINSDSPETYFGWSRNEFLANGEANKPGVQSFEAPQSFSLNKLYFNGSWNIGNESASNEKEGDSIFYKYRSSKMYFVASSELGAEIEIYKDGVLQKGVSGTDINIEGKIKIKDAGLYTLVNDGLKGEHLIEIRVIKGKINAFTFTFG